MDTTRGEIDYVRLEPRYRTREASDAPVNTCGRDQEEEEKYMPQSEQFEVLVLGRRDGRQAYRLAHGAIGTTGTAVVEDTLGWRLPVPNIACMPSKGNEISSAKVAQLARANGRHLWHDDRFRHCRHGQ